jgi:aspartate/glutamate racemase
MEIGMKRIALIHTVGSVYGSFGPALQKMVGEKVKIHNVLDDFLASDPAETGEFSETNRQRLANDVYNCVLTGADIIVVTCSTLTPAVTALRQSIPVPLVAIDDEMCRRAATFGKNVTVLATATSTVAPTTGKILEEAKAAGIMVEITSHVCPEAIVALKRGDVQTHDDLVAKMALKVKNQDVVVLAQASMAHMADSVKRICGCPVLSSPDSCMREIVSLLGGGQ